MAPSGRKSTGKTGTTKPKKVASDAKKRKKGSPSYKSYIHALLKGKGRITTKGVAIVNSFATDLFERLATEASQLNTYSGAKTLSSKAVVAAVRLQLPRELADGALSAGAKAVGKYSKTK
jgi:histone H2B